MNIYEYMMYVIWLVCYVQRKECTILEGFKCLYEVLVHSVFVQCKPLSFQSCPVKLSGERGLEKVHWPEEVFLFSFQIGGF